MRMVVAAFILAMTPGCVLLPAHKYPPQTVAPTDDKDDDDLQCWSFDKEDIRCHYTTKNNAK